MRMKTISVCAPLLGALFLVAGCAAPGRDRLAAPQGAATGSAEHGRAFAQQRCASCHAVTAGLSPNPEAPPFAAVVNTPGLSDATLSDWLRRSHNFPQMMNFTIAPEEIDSLAAYMLTLKSPGYRPSSQ